jgi:CHAD domain-containing protein
LTRFAQTVSSQPQLPHLLTDTRQVAESEAFMNQATQLLEQKAAVIFAFQSSSSGPQADHDAELHRLRINVKKCRYSLEMLHLLYANRFEKAIELAKELQEVLGQIHDFAVLIGLLNVHRVHLMETSRIHLAKGCQQIVIDLGEHRKRLVPSVAPAYESFVSELGHALTVETRSLRSDLAAPEVEAHSQDFPSDIQKARFIVSDHKAQNLLTSTQNGT